MVTNMAVGRKLIRGISICLAIIIAAIAVSMYIFQDGLSFWYAENRKTAEAYRVYLESYPNGKHSFKANWMIESIKHPATFAIGVYKGLSPFDYFSGVANPVLSREDVMDRQASLVADPFIIQRDNIWYMFFEVENESNLEGDIGYAKSEDGFQWSYGKIVLDEPFHLSYPYVFEHGSDHYMIPESNAVSSVRLYKATDFPEKWKFEATLLTGERFSDNSIVQYNGQWWLFSETSSRPHDNGTLRLYFADNLKGPWKEHPKSPVVKGDPNIARPGGRIVAFENNIFRFAQDCEPVYGYQVWVFKITRLTPDDYSEVLYREAPVIKASGDGWNRLAMHHIDPHQIDDGQWIVCVDGFGDIQ